ncbi:MAG: hypothetical protein H8D23_22540 [Candidatus Brocadiales bacterium]|nr:hypothetical protein [Candidatus Brocadiales bacterium]
MINFLSLSILNNFICYADKIILTPKLSIIRLDKISDPRAVAILGDEAIELAKDVDPRAYKSGSHKLIPVRFGVDFVHRAIEISNFALQWQYVDEGLENFPNDFERTANLVWFSSAITSLRLLKKEFIARFPTQSVGDPNTSTVQGGLVISSPIEEEDFITSKVPHLASVYVLTTSDIENLKKVLNAVNSSRNTNILIAISRLNRQYSRDKIEDRLIDLVIGFESLYLVGINDELKFRLALRVSAHLGKIESLDRQKIYEIISSAYIIRSKLVHGVINDIKNSKEFKKGSWVKPSYFLDELTDLLRTAIFEILVNIGKQEFKSQFHKNLDNLIIQGI